MLFFLFLLAMNLSMNYILLILLFYVRQTWKTKLTLVSSVWALIYIYFDRVYLIICMARKLFVREWLRVTCDLILICNKKNIRSYYFLGNERFFLFYAIYLALTSQMLSKRKLMASAKWRSNIEYRKRIIHLSFS